MTLRYVQVTQQDLQREFHHARQRAAQPPPSPNSHSLATLPIPICWESARHWRLRVISWRCIAASSVTPKPSASCGAWIDDSSPSPHTWSGSHNPKNEERLAGQQAKSWNWDSSLPPAATYSRSGNTGSCVDAHSQRNEIPSLASGMVAGALATVGVLSAWVIARE